ncbi:MAG: hypothetical protein PQJ46_09865 [Spirochaetales bacterium]|nr:hypothetical protein [Spirochaetales bacterium]
MNSKLRMTLLIPTLVICAGTIIFNTYIAPIPEPIVVALTAVAAGFLFAAVIVSRKK